MTSSKDMNEKNINLDDEIPPLEDIDEQMIEEEVQIDEEGNNKNDDDDGFIMAKKSTKKRKLPPVSTEDVKMDVQQPEIKKGKEMINWEMRKISVPPHRYTPLKKNWSKLVTPIINELKMQIRYNLRTRNVEIRCPIADGNKTFLQKAADFVQAFLLGFNIEDAISLIRFDHIFMESFEINDVKTLRGDHLSRAIGRIAGKDGRVKATIESVTQTRIVLADDKIHLLGAFNNLRIARHTICSLILGTPINKIHGNLRSLASRLAEQL